MNGDALPTHGEPSKPRIRGANRFGPGHIAWKGGRYVNSRGYVTIYVGYGHHLALKEGPYAYEHRVVAEQKIGRRLKPGEVVHHINENKSDNRPENLEVLPSGSHHHHYRHNGKPHNRAPGEPNPWVLCACGCGKKRRRYDKTGVYKRFIRWHHLRKGYRWPESQ